MPKSCITPNCTNPRFSGGLCRFHWGLEQVNNPKKRKKVAFGNKAAKRVSVARLKKDLKVLYMPTVRMEAADDNGICTCVCCGKRLPWKPEMIDNGERMVLPPQFMTTGHWIAVRKSKSVEFRRWNTHCQCNDCNWKEPPTFTFFIIKTYGQDKADWFVQQSTEPWKPTPYEICFMIDEYIQKFKEQCERLNYIPSKTEQRIIDKYNKSNS